MISPYRPPVGGRLLLSQTQTGVNGGHKWLPLVETQCRDVSTFTGTYGIYKCLGLCDSLRVKFHDQSPLVVIAGSPLQRLPGVEKAGETPLF